VRARIRTAEDAAYTLTLERSTGARVVTSSGRSPLGRVRTPGFTIAPGPGAYRLVLRLVATANHERRTTIRSRVFRVG
jgi:hypothetical protein